MEIGSTATFRRKFLQMLAYDLAIRNRWMGAPINREIQKDRMVTEMRYRPSEMIDRLD